MLLGPVPNEGRAAAVDPEEDPAGSRARGSPKCLLLAFRDPSGAAVGQARAPLGWLALKMTCLSFEEPILLKAGIKMPLAV